MQTTPLPAQEKNKQTRGFYAAAAWLALALLALAPAGKWLGASFPIFTAAWLLPSLIVLLITRDAGRLGIRRVERKTFLEALSGNVLGVFLVMALLEPWSHAYQALVEKAVAVTPPDPTFAWLVRFPGTLGLLGMFLYAGFISMFAEELFFRGCLLQWLGKKMPALWAILLQALLFSLPQAIAGLFLSPVQGLVYGVAYSFMAVGVIGGWAAWRTKSIWPSLVTVSLMNLIFVVIVQGI